ncbi:hypothetical protein [Piscinibacter sp. HJYY11]|uniref:hypothetical protein n=1 Tax=Piscinibacter sp. HJYY11 TaxID=2801333 RepID=UPI00191F93E3|nr:hypothetical protein [Piscinibacter sp. HJYY11]MBL0728809.1 hypothetical protein [Piscinibacter sp. HJYY11]
MQTTDRSGRRVPPRLHTLCALTLALAAGAAQAQDSNFGVTFGTKVWFAEWSTWVGDVNTVQDDVINQLSSEAKPIIIPQVSFRYRDFIGSLSFAVPKTYEFKEPSGRWEFERREIDANFGYSITPGLTASVGFKKFDQINAPTGTKAYQVSGPTLGVSAASPLAGGFSVYGALGIGVLKIKSDTNADFKADYSLSEVGLGYTVPFSRFIRSMNFSVGYRSQVIKARDVVLTDRTGTFPPVKTDARDVTQGFTLGAVFAF